MSDLPLTDLLPAKYKDATLAKLLRDLLPATYDDATGAKLPPEASIEQMVEQVKSRVAQGFSNGQQALKTAGHEKDAWPQFHIFTAVPARIGPHRWTIWIGGLRFTDVDAFVTRFEKLDTQDRVVASAGPMRSTDGSLLGMWIQDWVTGKIHVASAQLEDTQYVLNEWKTVSPAVGPVLSSVVLG